MLKTIIVDDDQLIRESLKESVEWLEYGFEIVGEAQNGKEALKLIQNYEPELVISDVKMPIMDGLELLEALKDMETPPKVVMISGYSDFQFVRDALKLGARNYILKPLNIEEVVNTLKSLSDEFEWEAKDQGFRKQGIEALRNDVLHRLIHNQIGSKELSEKLELLSLTLEDKFVQVGIISFYDNLQTTNINFPELNQYIVDRLTNEFPVYVFQGRGNDLNILFPIDLLERHENIIKNKLTELIKRINNRFHIDCTISIGTSKPSYRKSRISYIEALKSQDYRIIYGRNSVILYQDIMKIVNKEIDSRFIPTAEISGFILTQNKKGMATILEKLYTHTLSESQRSPDEIIFATFSILSEINNILKQENINDPVGYEGGISLLNIIKEMDDISEVKEWVQLQTYEAMEKILDKRNAKYSKIIKKVIDYTYKNYNEVDLSLKELSYKLNISATHLGRTFRNETGEYFSDYLNRLRINTAKELLLTKDFSAKEVGIQVGFENVNYFYTLFKKHTGVNTRDYKKSIIDKEGVNHHG